MKIQDFLLSAGKASCLACCYTVAALGEKATPTMIFDVLWRAAKNNAIDEYNGCFVNNAVSLMLTANPNKKYYVTKQKITSLEELNGQLAAVNFQNGNFNHWVLVENNVIIFDSLENSVCVERGKPTSARVIKIGDL